MTNQHARIDLVMDLPPGDRYHDRTVDALRRAAAARDIAVDLAWLPTARLAGEREQADGLLVGPGSPYDDFEAVIALIRRAREDRQPFVGT